MFHGNNIIDKLQQGKKQQEHYLVKREIRELSIFCAVEHSSCFCCSSQNSPFPYVSFNEQKHPLQIHIPCTCRPPSPVPCQLSCIEYALSLCSVNVLYFYSLCKTTLFVFVVILLMSFHCELKPFLLNLSTIFRSDYL